MNHFVTFLLLIFFTSYAQAVSYSNNSRLSDDTYFYLAQNYGFSVDKKEEKVFFSFHDYFYVEDAFILLSSFSLYRDKKIHLNQLKPIVF